MRTIACPACSEIIPDDVDYCPHCGESTKVTAESLMTDEDRLVAERMAARVASNTADAPPNPDLKLPPEAGEPVCMMCKLVPPTVGDYCQECNDKLELGPEQWQLRNQDALRNNVLVIILVVLALIAAGILLAHALHHPKRTSGMPAASVSATIPFAARADASATAGSLVLTSNRDVV